MLHMLELLVKSARSLRADNNEALRKGPLATPTFLPVVSVSTWFRKAIFKSDDVRGAESRRVISQWRMVLCVHSLHDWMKQELISMCIGSRPQIWFPWEQDDLRSCVDAGQMFVWVMEIKKKSKEASGSREMKWVLTLRRCLFSKEQTFGFWARFHTTASLTCLTCLMWMCSLEEAIDYNSSWHIIDDLL